MNVFLLSGFRFTTTLQHDLLFTPFDDNQLFLGILRDYSSRRSGPVFTHSSSSSVHAQSVLRSESAQNGNEIAPLIEALKQQPFWFLFTTLLECTPRSTFTVLSTRTAHKNASSKQQLGSASASGALGVSIKIGCPLSKRFAPHPHFSKSSHFPTQFSPRKHHQTAPNLSPSRCPTHRLPNYCNFAGFRCTFHHQIALL